MQKVQKCLNYFQKRILLLRAPLQAVQDLLDLILFTWSLVELECCIGGLCVCVCVCMYVRTNAGFNLTKKIYFNYNDDVMTNSNSTEDRGAFRLSVQKGQLERPKRPRRLPFDSFNGR